MKSARAGCSKEVKSYLGLLFIDLFEFVCKLQLNQVKSDYVNGGKCKIQSPTNEGENVTDNNIFFF